MTLPTSLDARHLTQAAHNESLLHEHCFPDPCTQPASQYSDWTLIISFYVALHYLHAYLNKMGYQTEFESHRERNDYLKDDLSRKDSTIDHILTDYLNLYKLSKLARYTPCHYAYFQQRLLCRYATFAMKTLPKALHLI